MVSRKRKSSSLFQSFLHAFTPISKRRRLSAETNTNSNPQSAMTPRCTTFQSLQTKSLTQHDLMPRQISTQQPSSLIKNKSSRFSSTKETLRSKDSTLRRRIVYLNDIDNEREDFIEFSTPKKLKENERPKKITFISQPQYNFVSLREWMIELSPLTKKERIE